MCLGNIDLILVFRPCQKGFNQRIGKCYGIKVLLKQDLIFLRTSLLTKVLWIWKWMSNVLANWSLSFNLQLPSPHFPLKWPSVKGLIVILKSFVTTLWAKYDLAENQESWFALKIKTDQSSPQDLWYLW